MIPNPILRVLSSIQTHRVRALLMGGQACVLYGAAEFSRDTDFAILASPANLARLQAALVDLRAHVIAVPPFEGKYLRRGHAVPFRCEHPEALNLRIDVMTRMRGVAPFSALWRRRNTFELAARIRCEVMALEDLVKAKKTQRDKDWPMLRRLMEAHYFANRQRATPVQIALWFRELRTPELLVEAARRWPAACKRLRGQRALLSFAMSEQQVELRTALAREEEIERGADALYWGPLKAELEALRRERLRSRKEG